VFFLLSRLFRIGALTKPGNRKVNPSHKEKQKKFHSMGAGM